MRAVRLHPPGDVAHLRLDEVEVPVMGVVLNGVPSKQMETFEFHRSYTARRADAAPALNAPSAPPVPFQAKNSLISSAFPSFRPWIPSVLDDAASQ